MQIHSAAYRNPAQMPDGAVLVVGAGSSGTQIADELLRSGKQVYLSIGPHGRPPRRYRGLDYVWWLGVLGEWDAIAPRPGTEHVTISVSGAHGGETVDFRRLAARGMILTGMTEAFRDGVLYFAADLAKNIGSGDANYLAVLDAADAYAIRYGLDLPPEPEARIIDPAPQGITDPVRELDLCAAGVNSIIWATGDTTDYDWRKVDVFDDNGRPRHQNGVTTEPGLYFLGLPWLSRRGSSFIYGVWHDALYLADHIAKQHRYFEYQASLQDRQPHP
jgi:putative flavoprotein involved in K+ transport